jgi:hypothetical protein
MKQVDRGRPRENGYVTDLDDVEEWPSESEGGAP